MMISEVETADLEDPDPQRLKEKPKNKVKQIIKILVCTEFFIANCSRDSVLPSSVILGQVL